MSQPSKIFISYTRSDEDFALDLYRALTGAGLEAWIDQHGLMKGQPWDQSVERTLKESDAVVVVLSTQSVASHAVLDEISYALDNGKQVLPVLLQVCQLPLRLNRFDYFDFARGKATMADVVAALGARVPPPPPPRRRVAVLVSLLVLALGALAGLKIADVRSASFCADTAWQAQDYKSPLLAKCGSCQPCLDRRAHASLLLGVPDWKRVAWDSPLLADCMSLPVCSERRAQAEADRLRARADEDRSRHAAASRPAPPIAPHVVDFRNYQCCSDAGARAEECRQWKRRNNRLASDCAGL